MEIDGHTRIIPHLAFPSAHLRTPALFNARCRALQLNAVVVPWEVPPESLSRTVASLRDVANVAGMIVTIPHKESAALLCDQLLGVAAELSVTNIIQRTADGKLVGALHDGVGFVRGLTGSGYDLTGKNTLLIGAGGAATALAHALIKAGIASLTIFNRGQERALRLVGRLRHLFPAARIQVGPADATGFDLIVNATSVGLDGDAGMPLDARTIPANACVADIIMKPAMTSLLAAAQARGARIHLGEHMLTSQIDSFIEFLLEPTFLLRPTSLLEPTPSAASG